MNRRLILLAFIISTTLTAIVGVLSNLAATYLSPTWAGNPTTIYIALVVTFFLSLVASSYLFRKTLSSDIDSETPSTKQIDNISSIQKSQNHVHPVPKQSLTK